MAAYLYDIEIEIQTGLALLPLHGTLFVFRHISRSMQSGIGDVSFVASVLAVPSEWPTMHICRWRHAAETGPWQPQQQQAADLKP